MEQEFFAQLKEGNFEATVETAQNLFELNQNIFDSTSSRNNFIGFIHVVARFAVNLGSPIKDAILLVQTLEKKITASDDSNLQRIIPLMVAEFDQLIAAIPTQYNSVIVNRAISYINEKIFVKLSNDDLAQYLQISVSYLSSHFKTITGMTLKSFVLKRKIEVSKDLLVHTDQQINDISYRLNFSNQSHFTKIFKEETGFTPHKYRNLFFDSK